ncbi:SDR family oxidoreductase [Gibbsiella greigii]
MNLFSGKVAAITGGSNGIGLAAAKLLRQQGANVAVCGQNQPRLAQAESELGVMACQTDVSDTQQLAAFYAATAERFGPIDVLLVNAGVFESRPLAEVDEAFFDWQFRVNTKGAYFSVQQALPYLLDGSAIVLTSSMVHSAGWPGCSVYAASKAAVRSLARSFAAELAVRNIRVNSLSPGVTQTAMLEWPAMTPEQRSAGHEALRARTPLGRFAAPEQIAQAMLFLASPDGYMTGGDVLVDGGITTL